MENKNNGSATTKATVNPTVEQLEKDWSNKTFTQDTMIRILGQTFDAVFGWDSQKTIFITFSECRITLKLKDGSWSISKIDEVSPEYYEKVAELLVKVGNFLDNANWILDQYKSAESTGDIASMFKYHKTLLEWGLTQDEINDFNWFNNSYKYFENK